MTTRDSAETLALQALGWLLGQEELLPGFLAASGAAPGDLAGLARDPEFMGAVLDFLLQDDQMVIAFCDAAGLRYEAPMQARAFLPGGPGPHWT